MFRLICVFGFIVDNGGPFCNIRVWDEYIKVCIQLDESPIYKGMLIIYVGGGAKSFTPSQGGGGGHDSFEGGRGGGSYKFDPPGG